MAFCQIVGGGVHVKEVLLLLSLTFLLLALAGRGTAFSFPSQEDDLELENELNLLNKPSIKTIQTADGDIFDCVDITKQPAFANPLLKDHKLQMRPTSYPKGWTDEGSPESMFPQIELEDGGCPQGTVPIQRVWKDDLIRAKSSLHIRKKYPANDDDIKKFAVTETYIDKFYGGAADLNVYGLTSVGQNQASETEVWVTDYHDKSQEIFNVIQAGWTVNPEIFNDTKTRIFIYWTADGYNQTGCYNLLCPGFVQISGRSPLGKNVDPLSTYMGKQYIVRVIMFKDQVTGNWWLAYGVPPTAVGYWPKEIFNNFDRAYQVHYGGVATYLPNGQRGPPMGNGHFAEEPNGGSCFVEKIQYVNGDNKLVDVYPGMQYGNADSPTCYSIGSYDRIHGPSGHRFHFGGPGC